MDRELMKRQRAALIRHWATEHDHEVPERGPLPDDMVAAFTADNRWLLALRDTVQAEFAMRKLNPRARLEIPSPDSEALFPTNQLPSKRGRYGTRSRIARLREQDRRLSGGLDNRMDNPS
jgi:hypothetical protein